MGVQLNILVRNLSKGATEKELLQLFLPFGRIKSLNIVTDKATGRSKGFGFVDMPEDSEAAAAIKALNGKLFRGEKLRVKTTSQKYSPSQSKPDRARQERFEDREMKHASKGKNSGTRSAKPQKPKRDDRH